MRKNQTRTFQPWWGLLLVIAACGDSTSDEGSPAFNDGSSDRNLSDGQVTADASSGGYMNGSGGAAGSAGTTGGGGTGNSGGTTPSDAGTDDDGAVTDVRSTSDADVGPITIATGAGKPTGIALSATAVYWADEEKGTISMCPKTGCGSSAPVVVTTIPSPRGIAVHGSSLFLVSAGQADASVAASVKKCTLGACAPNELVDLGANAFGPLGNVGIAADDQRFYVVGGPRAVTCPVAGCGDAGISYLGNFRGPIFSIAVDATTAYLGGWFRGLSACPLSGCSSPEDETAVTTAYSIMGLALDDTNLYWSEYSYSNASSSTYDGAIRTCPKSGCDIASAKVLAAGLIGPFGIAVDDANLYYADHRNGRVERILKNDFAHTCVTNHLVVCEGCSGVTKCDGTCTASCADAGSD